MTPFLRKPARERAIFLPLPAPQPDSAQERNAQSGHAIAAILDLLHRGKRFLLCSHTRPDGDSVGSMLALGMILEKMGKRVDLAAADAIPPHYRQFPGVKSIRRVASIRGHYDAAVLLECGSVERTRLRGLEKLTLINIDHHVTGCEFAHLNWIDRDAASTGEMVYRLAQAAGVAITPQMAHCIYATLLTDTGGFCYGNLGESTFALARDMVAAGADPIAIAREVYFSAPLSRLLLLGAALRRLKREGPLAWLWITPRDIERTAASEEDCEGIVNAALSTAGVDAVVFLREMPGRIIRVSLRSKSGLNVAAIAARLGGGGHKSAAGCTLHNSLPRALNTVLTELRSALAGQKRKALRN
jgi:phosphoesterase RecJ-like protein